MAALVGTVVAVHSYASPHGPAKDSSGNPCEFALVDATFTGTYASADDATILTLPTQMANKIRNGKTITVLDISAAAPGKLSTGVVAGAKGASYATTTATATITQADLSTELADGAATVSEPISFAVMYISS